MKIAIFSQTTTEQALKELTAIGASYEGLHVEMDDPEQRKFVKEKAETINGLLKKLDRARINLSKAGKKEIDDEAAQIKEILQKANEPFTLLTNNWSAQRKLILDKEKAVKAQAELEAQIEADHEQALLIDKVEMLEQKDRKAEEERRVLEIKEKAVKDEQFRVELEERKKQDEQDARDSDVAHRRAVNRFIISEMSAIGISEETGEKLITKIAQNKFKHLKINYSLCSYFIKQRVQ